MRCPHGRNQGSLTGSEIEHIWKQETQLKGIVGTKEFNDTCREYFGGNLKQLVDFKLLKDIIDNNGIPRNNYQKAQDNLQLFFQKLSESSSFAHLTHKKLKELNK